jgi:uncharacterized protein YndB with AHSA1/START domain
MQAALTLSIAIDRPPAAVYEFVSDPRNLPRWAKGLGSAIKPEGVDWIVETLGGPVRLRFAEPNELGVLDHYVRPAQGPEVYIPMRVVANGLGSELTFTLFRTASMSEQAFEEDSEAVKRDLESLKAVLERDALPA